MDRREYLRTATAVGFAGSVAGCAGLLDSNPNVTLDEPDREFDSEDLPYPAWGEQVPDVSLADPLTGETFHVRDADDPSVLTFFYSHCNSVCPVLISTVRDVHTHALNEGYADEVVFLPVTFDPERDDEERLRAYADEMNVDADADNWHFLRPDSEAEAEQVVEEQFGVMFERTEPEDMDMYMFNHASLTFLVNADGYVERAYRTESPDETEIISDLETVRE
ncbi:SCO family protein [Halorussus salilacus]|uniref:SCO family protein n=1 Tax=Halorussus salilacus TaxID=2953750 RepID=UPI00209E718F|nr:SCO family protein [Halorussus salilacus]USZ68987.1 SCO family protein [Halorussus salilacus]